jgi:hypothetical protein
MRRIIIVAILSFFATGYTLAQFNPCSIGVPGFCGRATSGPPPTPCTSTGIYDLSNTCNDIYFIGALK